MNEKPDKGDDRDRRFIRWEDVDKAGERLKAVQTACDELRRYVAVRYGVVSQRKELSHG